MIHGPRANPFITYLWGPRSYLVDISPRVQSTQIRGTYCFYTRNRSTGLGKILCIWVLGPLGPGKRRRLGSAAAGVDSNQLRGEQLHSRLAVAKPKGSMYYDMVHTCAMKGFLYPYFGVYVCAIMMLGPFAKQT